jgi:hypothetical protein
MNLSKTTAALAMVALVGVTGACGGNSSSSTASAGSPSAASKTTFCSTFTSLSNNTTPKDASTKLGAVGTPSDITTEARHGFDVLIANLAKLPDNAKSSDFTAMQKGLSTTDQTDVAAFGVYLQKECAPTTSSSTSPSPSS